MRDDRSRGISQQNLLQKLDEDEAVLLVEEALGQADGQDVEHAKDVEELLILRGWDAHPIGNAHRATEFSRSLGRTVGGWLGRR